jgi:hypothetical protein
MPAFGLAFFLFKIDGHLLGIDSPRVVSTQRSM